MFFFYTGSTQANIWAPLKSASVSRQSSATGAVELQVCHFVSPVLKQQELFVFFLKIYLFFLMYFKVSQLTFIIIPFALTQCTQNHLEILCEYSLSGLITCLTVHMRLLETFSWCKVEISCHLRQNVCVSVVMVPVSKNRTLITSSYREESYIIRRKLSSYLFLCKRFIQTTF